MNRPKILITGGAGFIGSALTRHAIKKGCRVIVVDNLCNGSKNNLEGLPGDQVELVVADIRDRNLMKAELGRVDIVFHLACMGLRHSIHSPIENQEINAGATIELLEICRKVGVKRFIFTSSAEVYGSECSGPVSEDNPLKPTNVYGAAKLAAESYVQSYYNCYGLDSIILRLFNVYGPRSHHEGDSGEIIPKFFLRSIGKRPLIIFGDGSQTRDFNYVSDTVRAIFSAGYRDEAIGQVINVGSGVETSINELARKISNLTVGREPIIRYEGSRPGDVTRMVANGTKAKKVLGYRPMISLDDGLQNLKRWYLRRESSIQYFLSQEIEHNWDLGEIRRLLGVGVMLDNPILSCQERTRG